MTYNLNYLNDNKEEKSLIHYFNAIRKYKPLTLKQEKVFAIRIQRGDKSALEALVKANLRFVIGVALTYRSSGIPLSDLINEGNIGLINAAKKYNQNKNFKFISYAVWWIRQSILALIARQSRLYHLPNYCASNIYKVRKANQNLEQKLKRQPTQEEIAQNTNLSLKALKLVESNDQKKISLDSYIGDKEDPYSLYDIVENEKSENPDEHVIKESVSNSIRKAIDTLPNREKKVIELYFGLNENNPFTLEDIGDHFKVSRERIRQLKNRALFRLKANHNKKLLKDCL
jgi:RNA polymerase primary sigma factor